jgi:hypothetical protein
MLLESPWRRKAWQRADYLTDDCGEWSSRLRFRTANHNSASPREIADFLGVKNLDWLRISVLGTSLVEERKQLVSGIEIRDTRLKSGERIRVTATLLSPRELS